MTWSALARVHRAEPGQAARVSRAHALRPVHRRCRMRTTLSCSICRRSAVLPAERDNHIAAPEREPPKEIAINRLLPIVGDGSVTGAEDTPVDALKLDTEVAQIPAHAELTRNAYDAGTRVPAGFSGVEVEVAVARRLDQISKMTWRIPASTSPPPPTGRVRVVRRRGRRLLSGNRDRHRGPQHCQHCGMASLAESVRPTSRLTSGSMGHHAGVSREGTVHQ